MNILTRLPLLLSLCAVVISANEDPVGPDSPPASRPQKGISPPTIMPPDTPPGYVEEPKIVEKDKLKNPLARGWGDDIDWVAFQEGFQLARDLQKPMMLVIHKTWCHACKNLKRMFGKAKQIVKLSKNFVMVNVENGEEPVEDEFKPDGNYIPRIFFLNPQGQVLYDIINPKKEFPDTKFYYSNPAPIITAMEKAIKRFAPKAAKKEEL